MWTMKKTVMLCVFSILLTLCGCSKEAPYPYTNKEPNMVLLQATKGGKSRITVEKPLIVYNEDGTYTDEILKIYNKQKGEK